jgi:hypothetical protein
MHCLCECYSVSSRLQQAAACRSVEVLGSERSRSGVLLKSMLCAGHRQLAGEGPVSPGKTAITDTFARQSVDVQSPGGLVRIP